MSGVFDVSRIALEKHAMDMACKLVTFRPMRTRFLIFGLPLVALVSCATDEVREGPKPPPAASEWTAADPAKLTVSAVAVPGGLDISEKGKLISRVRCGRPIERWVFVKEGRDIVIRCSNAEGPATIELYDSHTAIQRDSIGADQVIAGRPAWAASLADTRRFAGPIGQ